MVHDALKWVLGSLKSSIISFRHFGIYLAQKRGEVISITLVLFVIFVTATKTFFPDENLVQFNVKLPQAFNKLLFIVTTIYGVNTFYIIFIYVGDILRLLNPKKILVNIVDFSLVFNLFITNLLFMGLIISAWLFYLKNVNSIGFLSIIISIMLLFSAIFGYLPLIVICLGLHSFCEHVLSDKNILNFVSVVKKSIKAISRIFFCFMDYVLWCWPRL